MIADISEEDGIEGWVQEKIIKASDYLNTVREYMEQKRFANEMTGGVIGNGMAGESISEGKMAELEMDLEDPELSEKHFKQLYGMSRREARETFSQTNTWDFPEVRDPNKKLHEQGVAEDVSRQNLDFDSLYGKVFKIVDNSGNPDNPGFSIVTPLNGESWNWHERPEFKNIVKQRLNDPAFLGDHKYQQIIDALSGNKFDTFKHQMKEIKQGVAESKSKVTCGCGSECTHCGGKHSRNEVGKKCSCCGNMIKLGVGEGWSQKYKDSINCSHPKGFSQKAHCAGKKKHNESITMETGKQPKKNPYAIGMAQAMKSTGDQPPLKKSTITKAHNIAKSIKNKG